MGHFQQEPVDGCIGNENGDFESVYTPEVSREKNKERKTRN